MFRWGRQAAINKRVQAEYQRFVDGITLPADLDKGSDEEKKKVKEQLVYQHFRQQLGLSDIEIQIMLQVRAGLRALSEGKVPAVEAKEIDDQYISEYDERRVIRLVPVTDMKIASDIRKQIDQEKKTP